MEFCVSFVASEQFFDQHVVDFKQIEGRVHLLLNQCDQNEFPGAFRDLLSDWSLLLFGRQKIHKRFKGTVHSFLRILKLLEYAEYPTYKLQFN